MKKGLERGLALKPGVTLRGQGERGKATVVTAEYPGGIPADRLAVLDELLELDRASMEAWRKR